MTSFTVSLNIYDLTSFDTSGMIHNTIKQIIPSFEGIWHSGIVVYGKEYYYGGGLFHGIPGATPYGIPTKNISLGTTQIPEDVFEVFVEEMRSKYKMENYDLFENNCNHFTNDASQFLTGNTIPDYIINLPQLFLQTPMGQMLMPMIRQFTRGAAMDPSNAQANMANMMNNLGNMGNMGNMMNNMGNMGNMANMMNNLGGLGGLGNGLFNTPPSTSSPTNSTPPSNTSSINSTVSTEQIKKGHEALSFKRLVVRTKQSTLYSSSTNLSKIILKLKQVLHEQDSSFLTPERVTILTELQKGLENRNKNANYTIPKGCFNLMTDIIQVLPAKTVFPVIDLLRLFVLHPTAAEYFSNPAFDLIDSLVKKFCLCDTPPSIPAQWLTARVVCNLCGSESSGKNMIISSRIDYLMDIIILGLESSDVKQMKHTSATIAFNAALRCLGNNDIIMQILSAVCHSISIASELGDDVIFTLLMALGRLLYNNQEAIDLASALELNVSQFLNNKTEKIKEAAKEVKLLLDTPVE